jgi:alkylation response protein AidB-like acyl-CoA dehydrogenase
MNFGFSEEQELLRAEVRKFLDQNASLEEVRRICEDESSGFARNLWDRMAELGWVGLTMPEEHGGVGMDFVTLIVVLEETGRSLFPSPLISTVLAARAIEVLGDEEQQARWLPGLADGSRIGSFALLEVSDRYDARGVELRGGVGGGPTLLTGNKHFVPDAGNADLFVVAYREDAGAEDISLAVIERTSEGVSTSDYISMDLTKRMGELSLCEVRIEDDVILGERGGAWPTIEKLIDTGAILVTAEAVGAAEAGIEITSDFARQRIQFDNPIGKYQSVKHPLAEMYVDTESFRSLVYYAAWCLDQDSDDLPLAASRAKAYASETLPRIGIDAVQLHGGVGFTWEYDIQLYLKRSKWMRPIYGDVDFHYDRLASLGGL